MSTAGEPDVPDDFAFEYVKALAQNYYGIRDARQVKATGLDIEGADVNAVMREAETVLEDMDLG